MLCQTRTTLSPTSCALWSGQHHKLVWPCEEEDVCCSAATNFATFPCHPAWLMALEQHNYLPSLLLGVLYRGTVNNVAYEISEQTCTKVQLITANPSHSRSMVVLIINGLTTPQRFTMVHQYKFINSSNHPRTNTNYTSLVVFFPEISLHMQF